MDGASFFPIACVFFFKSFFAQLLIVTCIVHVRCFLSGGRVAREGGREKSVMAGLVVLVHVQYIYRMVGEQDVPIENHPNLFFFFSSFHNVLSTYSYMYSTVCTCTYVATRVKERKMYGNPTPPPPLPPFFLKKAPTIHNMCRRGEKNWGGKGGFLGAKQLLNCSVQAPTPFLRAPFFFFFIFLSFLEKSYDVGCKRGEFVRKCGASGRRMA